MFPDKAVVVSSIFVKVEPTQPFANAKLCVCFFFFFFLIVQKNKFM